VIVVSTACSSGAQRAIPGLGSPTLSGGSASDVKARRRAPGQLHTHEIPGFGFQAGCTYTYRNVSGNRDPSIDPLVSTDCSGADASNCVECVVEWDPTAHGPPPRDTGSPPDPVIAFVDGSCDPSEVEVATTTLGSGDIYNTISTLIDQQLSQLKSNPTDTPGFLNELAGRINETIGTQDPRYSVSVKEDRNIINYTRYSLQSPDNRLLRIYVSDGHRNDPRLSRSVSVTIGQPGAANEVYQNSYRYFSEDGITYVTPRGPRNSTTNAMPVIPNAGGTARKTTFDDSSGCVIG